MLKQIQPCSKMFIIINQRVLREGMDQASTLFQIVKESSGYHLAN